MKRIVCAAAALILCLTAAVSVYAAGGPQKPTIEAEMPDCYGVIGRSDITLSANASTSDGGTLEYQWYSTTIDDISTIRAIDDATGTTFNPPEELGVVYYCYAVWNNVSGNRSQPVYSRLIRVEFSEDGAVTLELISAPNKVVYNSGETLDLTGLHVRIWTSAGSTESFNGDKLEVTTAPLTTIGEQKIKVSYGNAFIFFIVTVNEAPHVHAYGEWTTTTEATCTEVGIKTRECDCGHTERAEIPATGHKWDDGVITKEPTDTVDGAKTFTCTVCNETKTEAVKASANESQSADAPASSDDSSSSASDEGSGSSSQEQIAEEDQSSEFPWLIVTVAAAAVAACGGVVTALLITKKKK